MSYKVRQMSPLKGSKRGEALWVRYRWRRGDPDYGSGFETGLRRGQDGIVFLSKTMRPDNTSQWMLLRVERLGEKGAIISAIKQAGAKS